MEVITRGAVCYKQTNNNNISILSFIKKKAIKLVHKSM